MEVVEVRTPDAQGTATYSWLLGETTLTR